MSPQASDRPQGHEAFVEPPRDQIPAISRAHVEAMENSASDAIWRAAGMEHVLLRTIGRLSGLEHKVALPFWRDADGASVVVASFAGAPSHPAWYLNLCDRDANPEVLVRYQDGAWWAVAEDLVDDEYDATWARLVEDRPYYEGYQTRTDRKLPLVRLREVRPA